MTADSALPQIRTLSPTDSLGELTALLHHAYAPLAAMGLNYTAADQSVAVTEARVKAGVCFVAESHGRILGTIVVEGPKDDPECPYFAQPHVASAHQLAVLPSHQGMGIGSHLLGQAEAWSRANGYSELALDTAEPAKHLVALYERRGYKRVGSSQGLGKLYRSIFMAKKLEHCAMALPQEIEGERVRLRRPVAQDAETIFASYAQDALVCRFLVWRPHQSITTSREFIASCIDAWNSDTRRPYVITEKPSPAAVGMIEARMQSSTVDLGYVLARSHWGKGLMAEAITALAKASLAVPRFFRVQAFCDVENSQSQRALQKAGLRREGRLERWIVHPNVSAEPRACFMYAIVK